MYLIRPYHNIEFIQSNALELIEAAGRTCYKSEEKITANSSERFVAMVIRRGHHSVIEHASMTVRFICDRGVTHEIVRHRLFAFSQESTRFCNYKGGMTFIIPPWFDLLEGEYHNAILAHRGHSDEIWLDAMLNAEQIYIQLLANGQTPQQARSVLPNSLKTEIVCTANFREWRHVFSLRCASSAHPQMQEIMRPLLDEVKTRVPVVFDDIGY
jgi:thymidylate synthase (FAD)